MNIKSFFVAALSSALDLGLATSDDVVKHVTPDVLAAHLPRPLWARLLTACIGAPRVDARLVVDTIGVPNLCEHVPQPIMWACIADIAARSLGGVVAAATTTPASRPIVTRTPTNPSVSAQPKAGSLPRSLSTPPPPEVKPVVATPPAPTPAAMGPSIPSPASASAPLSNLLDELEAEDKDKDKDNHERPTRSRTASQRFRQTNTNIGRLANASNQRRPQAQAAVPTPTPTPGPLGIDPPTDRPQSRSRRGESEADFDIETDVSAASKEDWKSALSVEDEQLVDWSSSEETMTASSDSRDDRFRKR